MRAIQAAGIVCNSQRGGTHRRGPGVGAVDFSMYAFVSGVGSGEGIEGQDERVVGVGFAELIRGSHGKGTAAPLPSRNGDGYMRSGI